MIEIAVTRRPIVLETGASASMLTDILARQEAIAGRMVLYGVSDPLRASLLAGASVEADFRENYYRRGFVTGAAPSLLSGWGYSRSGSAWAATLSRTLEAFAADAARITDRGLLVESATTNLLVRSSEFDHASWSKTNISVTADAAVAPDGTTTADRIQCTATGSAYIYQVAAGAVNAAGNDFTVYARKGSSAVNANQFGVINSTSGANLLIFTINYDTGAIAISHQSDPANVAFATPQANDWWRIDLRIGAGGTPGQDLLVHPGFATTSVDGAYCFCWEALLKTGQGRSSPVHTTSATATRGADAPTAEVQASLDGAVFIEFDLSETPPPGVSQTPLEWNDGAGANRILIYRLDDQVRAYWSLAGVADSVGGTGFDQTQTVRACLRWANQKMSLYLDGEAVAEGVAFTGSTAPLDTVLFGSNFGGTENLTNFVRRWAAFSVPPSPAECLVMTTAPS